MPTSKPSKRDTKELLKRIRERYRVMVEADRENRQAAMDDLKFIYDKDGQWDKTVLRERGDRPHYTYNKLHIKAKRIVNEMRANRPQGKVRAVEDSDKDTADIYEGLCRNIANVSDADTVFDYAGEYQVVAGMGAWRVVTEYADDSAFEQDITVKAIKNPFCLYADPSAQDPLKRDAEDWILTDKISKSSFEARWPKAEKVSFEDNEFDDELDWEDDDGVRICEYWYKQPYQKEIWLLATGETIDSTAPEAQAIPPETIVRRRTANCSKIMMCIASGDAILEGPTEQAGKNHRFIMVYGEWVVVDGKTRWFGLTRTAKDAQMSYNVSRTAVTETIASAPNSKYWVTPAQAEGHLETWAESHKKNFPFLIANPDPLQPGPPQRMGGPDIPVALIQELQLADQELKDVTGVYDASLGERSNEKSGIAIARRSEQTQIVNFNFPDNMAKGIKRTWEIIVDLIPYYYDTARTVRILGRDGAEKYVKVNQMALDPTSGQQVALNDLSRGKYDVTVTVGPSFSTQRQEAAEVYGQLANSNPAVFGVAGDLIFKSMDLPYSEDIAERMQALLPPQIQQTLDQDKPAPPEVQRAMAQVQQIMQQVQAQGMLVQKAAEEATQTKTEADRAVSDLNVKRAQFDADVQKSLSGLTLKEAQLVLKDANQQAAAAQKATDDGQAQVAQLLQQAVESINQRVTDHMQNTAAVMADFQAKQQPQVIFQPAPPRPRVRAIERRNGQLVPIYDDEQQTIQ